MKPRHFLIECKNAYTLLKLNASRSLNLPHPSYQSWPQAMGSNWQQSNILIRRRRKISIAQQEECLVSRITQLEIQINQLQVIHPVCPKLVLISLVLVLKIWSHFTINKSVKILLVFVKTVAMHSKTWRATNILTLTFSHFDLASQKLLQFLSQSYFTSIMYYNISTQILGLIQ